MYLKDPSISDPLADKVEWTPLKKGGKSYITKVLNQNGANQYEYKATLLDILRGLTFFILLGLFPMRFSYCVKIFSCFSVEKSFSAKCSLHLFSKSVHDTFFIIVNKLG